MSKRADGRRPRVPINFSRSMTLSIVLKLGLVVLLVGAVLDVIYHSVGLPDPIAALFGPDGKHAHLLTFIGMLITLLSITFRSARHGRTGAALRDRTNVAWFRRRSHLS